MRVLSADLWEPAPGQILTWDVTPSAGSAPVPAVPTYNQRNHLLGAAAGEPSVWITAAFDVDGPVAPGALEAAFRDLVAAHPGLRVEAVRRPAPEDVALVRHDADGLRWRRHDGPVTRTVGDTREHLVERLVRRCAPFGYPAFLPAAISRPDRSTVVLGMDHLHTDAWSTTVVVDELAARYAERAGARLGGAARRGSAGTAAGQDGAEATAIVPDPSALGQPEVGPVLLDASDPGPHGPVPDPGPHGPAPGDAPGPAFVAPDDPRLAAWHGFLRERGWALPTFPLPLGVPEGERAPQRTVVRPLADAATADAVAARARAAGASTSAAVLVTLAGAVADLGGPGVLHTLLPVHTRADDAARRSVGWHTTTVPLRVDPGVGPAGAPARAWARPAHTARHDADTALAATAKALRAARELAAVPLEQVVGTLPSPLRFPRTDIFQVSYLDYRRLPGHAASAGRGAHHVSAATRADDLQVWVSRTDDGIAVRARMPRTPEAVTTVDAVLDRWSERLTGLAG
ncbi:hypothetical protein [Promicromonospora sukumoe]|uniref:Condensation domain-containing protein n=1 Tax=Promicromonospora sukumoe TaxID=88382 RepID=A0A7W3JB82_9MICO|nr:hypothetical protein [Promicromonospora sukumoe]MBA8809584.1 hypothetical protein [Promicromonospora sukumoe]